MQATTLDEQTRANGVVEGAETGTERALAGAAHQAFWLLRIGFTVAPILFGVDKFFNWTVRWPDYLAGGSTKFSRSPADRTGCTSWAPSRSSRGSWSRSPHASERSSWRHGCSESSSTC